MADALIDLLRAKLDETERIARAAAGLDKAFPTPEWEYEDGSDYVYALDRRGPRDIDVIHHQLVTGYSYGGPQLDDAVGRHIALHGPAQVLKDVAADRKILAWHPVQTRTANAAAEYTCPCLWDPYMEQASWHPEVLCELTGFIASRYGLEMTPCTCRDCTPKSQWAERGYGIEVEQ